MLYFHIERTRVQIEMRKNYHGVGGEDFFLFLIWTKPRERLFGFVRPCLAYEIEQIVKNQSALKRSKTVIKKTSFSFLHNTEKDNVHLIKQRVHRTVWQHHLYGSVNNVMKHHDNLEILVHTICE